MAVFFFTKLKAPYNHEMSINSTIMIIFMKVTVIHLLIYLSYMKCSFGCAALNRLSRYTR